MVTIWFHVVFHGWRLRGHHAAGGRQAPLPPASAAWPISVAVARRGGANNNHEWPCGSWHHCHRPAAATDGGSDRHTGNHIPTRGLQRRRLGALCARQLVRKLGHRGPAITDCGDTAGSGGACTCARAHCFSSNKGCRSSYRRRISRREPRRCSAPSVHRWWGDTHARRCDAACSRHLILHVGPADLKERASAVCHPRDAGQRIRQRRRRHGCIVHILPQLPPAHGPRGGG